ncbi:MAG: hypothetical protein WD533_06820 [Dehalococcoidia bacterium]
MESEPPPSLRIAAEARAELDRLGMEAWTRVFELLADPTPDGAHKKETPFPWSYVTFADSQIEIRYRLRADGGINIIDVRER